MDGGRGRDPVHLGHRQIHEDDVRFQAARHLYGLPAIGRLAEQLEVGVDAEERPQPLADHLMIVGDEQTDGHGSPRFQAQVGSVPSIISLVHSAHANQARSGSPGTLMTAWKVVAIRRLP